MVITCVAICRLAWPGEQAHCVVENGVDSEENAN